MAMTTQDSRERQALHLPNSYQSVGPCASDLCAIGTPGDIVQRDGIALQALDPQPMLDDPESQGAIITSAEQMVTVGSEGDRVHSRLMPMQYCSIPAGFDIPEPDQGVTPTTGEQVPIRTPSDSSNRGGVPCQCLEAEPAFYLPQLDGLINAPTGQGASIGGKGQPGDPAGMPCEQLHAGVRLLPGLFPYPYAPILAPTGEQAPIRTPGQSLHLAALAGECPQKGAGGGVPESNDAIPSTTGKCPSVGSKGDTLDLGGKPVRPEQSAALQVPQFDGSIPAPSCKRCAIQTESQGSYGVGMRLPGLVQDLPSLHPDLHIPPPATCCPGLPVGADGECPDHVKGLSEEGVTQSGSGQGGVLHLDALQKRPANGKPRQVQAVQMSTKHSQQSQQIGWPIALSIVCPGAQGNQQRQQALLHFTSLWVRATHLCQMSRASAAAMPITISPSCVSWPSICFAKRRRLRSASKPNGSRLAGASSISYKSWMGLIRCDCPGVV